jgi:hypothetical protein
MVKSGAQRVHTLIKREFNQKILTQMLEIQMPRTILKGKSGGNYYINKRGRKVYIHPWKLDRESVTKKEKEAIYTKGELGIHKVARAIRAENPESDSEKNVKYAYRKSKTINNKKVTSQKSKNYVISADKRTISNYMATTPVHIKRHKEYAT